MCGGVTEWVERGGCRWGMWRCDRVGRRGLREVVFVIRGVRLESVEACVMFLFVLDKLRRQL